MCDCDNWERFKKIVVYGEWWLMNPFVNGINSYSNQNLVSPKKKCTTLSTIVHIANWVVKKKLWVYIKVIKKLIIIYHMW